MNSHHLLDYEFDRGALNLRLQLQSWASFPFPVVSANYLFEDPKQLGTIVEPYTVFELDGLKVGVVSMGNLSSLTSIFDRPNRLGMTPLNTVETAQFYVDLIRPLVDVIVFARRAGT